MTVCNMAIEAGARAGLIAFDKKTKDYVQGRPYSPTESEWELALNQWQDLHSDKGCTFDKIVEIDISHLKPQVTWGTSPEMVVDIDSLIPSPSNESEKLALEYMGLEEGTEIKDIELDQIFIGSCTNSRIEDLRVAAKIIDGSKVNKKVKRAMVVPGSGLVDKQAREEGLDEIFISAGFEWRSPGCSMCLGMNPDQIEEKQHCASTSNRNFEGRQGYKGRTHLVSPATAAAAAIAGRFIDPRELI